MHICNAPPRRKCEQSFDDSLKLDNKYIHYKRIAYMESTPLICSLRSQQLDKSIPTECCNIASGDGYVCECDWSRDDVRDDGGDVHEDDDCGQC